MLDACSKHARSIARSILLLARNRRQSLGSQAKPRTCVRRRTKRYVALVPGWQFRDRSARRNPCLRHARSIGRQRGVGLRRNGQAGGSGRRNPTPPTPLSPPATPPRRPLGRTALGVPFALVGDGPHRRRPDLRKRWKPAGVRLKPRRPNGPARLARSGTSGKPNPVHPLRSCVLLTRHRR
jgi:hypothetical protein